MKCEYILKTVSKYLDGDMPGHDRLEFELHLDKCASCAAEVEAMESMVSSLRNLGARKSPVDCRHAVQARVRDARPKARRWYGFVLKPIVLAPALAASLVSLLIVSQPPRLVEQPVPQPVPLVSPAEYSTYVSAHSRAQRMEPLSDSDVMFVAAELEKADLTTDTLKP